MAEKYPYRNVITRAVGTDRNIKVDVANLIKTIMTFGYYAQMG